ncbi:putative Band 7 domain-containing protein [Dioscorea sansibarensis]
MGQLFCCLQVEQSNVAIRETFGWLDDVLGPGLHCLPWFLGKKVADVILLANNFAFVQQESDVQSNGLLQCINDNVFVTVVASIQYRAIAERAISSVTQGGKSSPMFLMTLIRSSVPKLNVDDVFEQKNDIADSVKEVLEKAMAAYGYDIVQTLIVDIALESV